jgi:hypothetical protein
LKIAVLNPYSGPVAEVESCQWLSLAAQSLGHEVVVCHDERQVDACGPDFVLNLSFQNPKLTRFATYGLLNLPTSILMSAPRFIRNCLTYDAVFVLSPNAAEWYSDLCFGVRKPANIFPLAVTTHSANLAGDIDFTTASIAYAGTNWDGFRLKDVFEQLAPTGEIFFYGPPEKWQHVDPRSVKGLVPFDGESLLRAYREHGVGLALAHPQFVAEQIPHNRIFEVAASGALAISSDYALVRDWFGDSFLYVDQTQDPRQVAEEIRAHLHWVRHNPDSAAAKASAAHRIFREKFAMEKLLAGALAYHEDVLIERRRLIAVDTTQDDPRISVVLRTGGWTSAAIGRALDSLVAQTYPLITALLVVEEQSAEFEALVARYTDVIDIRVVACAGDSGNSALRAGLREVRSECFSVMDGCDEYYPNHFALLLDRVGYLQRARSQVVKAVFSGSVRKSAGKELYESAKWFDNPAFAGPYHICIRNFGELGPEAIAEIPTGESSLPRAWLASADLLDGEILDSPDLPDAADVPDEADRLLLLLSLLEKTRFEFNYEITACVHVGDAECSGADAPLSSDACARLRRRMWGRKIFDGVELDRLLAQPPAPAVVAPVPDAAPSGPGAPAEPAAPASLLRRLVRSWAASRRKLPADFDGAAYLRHNPDVAQARIDPAEHFRKFGYREGRRWR